MTGLDLPDIALDDPDRATAAALLDEVMCGDHSNDSANAVVAQALKDAALAECSRWEQALADSKLPELYKRLVRDLARKAT